MTSCKHSVLELLVRFSRSARILTVSGWFCVPIQLRFGSIDGECYYDVLVETSSA
jgi:hypothetical protein